MDTENSQELKEQSHNKSSYEMMLRSFLITNSVLVVYVLSSGPMMKLCYWLHNRTGSEEILYILIIYQPLFWVGSLPPFDKYFYEYLGWWVPNLFKFTRVG